MKNNQYNILSSCLLALLLSQGLLAKSDPAAQGQSCLKDPSSCHLDTDVQDIIKVTQYLYKKGLEQNKDKDFDSGTYVIVDPGFALFDKLRDFVKSKYGAKKLCSEVTVTTKPAYPRKSTHFNALYLYNKQAKKGLLGGVSKTDCDYVHFGIDVDKGKLPMEGKKHILFGRVGTINGRDLTFLKMEAAGLRGLEVLSHGIDLIKKTAQRLLPGIFEKIKAKLGLVKVTKETIEKEFQDLLDVASFESDESELIKNRKERIPAEYLAYFLSLLLEAKDGKKDADFTKIKEKVKAFGVQAMVSTVEEMLAKTPNAPINDKLRSFVDLLKTQYPNDYCVRFGNEIIVMSVANDMGSCE